jgi:hypothetical protein
MPQEKVSFNKFGAGFVSQYDINELSAPPMPSQYVPDPEGACRDITNFEINAPSYCLKESTGSGVVYNIPAFSGSRIVAQKNWKVTSPSSKELTTLITASNNLLLYSEDFEISTVWTLTAGSATLTANSQVSPQLIRKADRLTNINATTSIQQLFPGLMDSFYTFSLYFKKTTAHRIRLTIADSNGNDTATSIDASGNWTRLSVGHQCAGGTGFLVKIDFPDSTGTDTCDIWGAQCEAGSSPTGYGYTFHYNLPYYILQRPYWNGVSWIDDWIDLTEMRCGIISASGNGTFTISGLDGINAYYNNWYAWDNTLAIPTGYITQYSAGGVFQIVGEKIADDGHVVVISRFPFFTETPYFQQGLIVESNISFVEISDSLKVSFGNTHRPLTIKYITSSAFGISEHLIPSSDISNSGWDIFPSLPVSIYDKIDTYRQTEFDCAITRGVGTHTFECKFNSTSNIPTVAKYEFEISDWSVALNTINFKADLYCGSVLIHTGQTHIAPSLLWMNIYTEYLSVAEVAAITAISGGWSDLRVRFTSVVASALAIGKIYYCGLFISGYSGLVGSIANGQFTLTYSSHIGVQPPSENLPVLPPATLSESEGVAFGASVITLTPYTSGTLTAGDYKIYVVGVIDGNQRIPIWTGNTTVSSSGSIDVTIPIVATGFDWRLTAIEIYIGSGTATPGDTSAYFFSKSILLSDILDTLTTSVSDNNWTIVTTITTLDSLQNTLMYNLGGCLDIIETRARYNIGFYLLGRMFIAQTQEPQNIVRYSNISGLTSEIDKFAYSSGGYGFFTFDSSMNQSVMNISRTIENDLLIIQENDVSIFEVQSGNSSAKRLRQMFTGIGSSNTHSLVISDYGNFWYDNNDVYWYQGGYAVPLKISEGRIRHYWRQILTSHISTSFAIFNRQVNEYWIFIYNGVRWIVLRFSPEFKNWNIWTPGFTPLWLSETMNGIVTIAYSTVLYQFGGSAIMSNPYIVTHKRKITPDAISPKQVEEVYISDYSTTNDITMALTIDNESAPRTGNSPVFKSTKKSQRRTIRANSSMNSVSIKLSTTAGSGAQINEFGLVVQGRKDRTGGRK